jgi:hypothetical protein
VTFYFAYGSNFDCRAMKRRCPGARAVGPAVLEGYRFFIGPGGGGSVAPALGSQVHGVLWRITPRDRAALNSYERIDKGLYEVCTVPVREGSRRVAAVIYILRCRTPGRLRPGYIDLVAAAARGWGLPEGYIRDIERWSRSPPPGAGSMDIGGFA